MERGENAAKGGIVLLLDHIGAKHLGHEQVTVALWRHLQSLTIAVEGELVTSDGRLMGRLDLLFADVDDAGQLQGWLVADLKTGRALTEVEARSEPTIANVPGYPPGEQPLCATCTLKGGTQKPPQSGAQQAKASSSKLTPLGKRPSPPPCR